MSATLEERRAAVEAWESDQLDRVETERQARVARAEAQAAADRLNAQQAAAAGKVCCAHCGSWADYAEPCWSCGAADSGPGEATDEPDCARLYELSLEALRERAAEVAHA